MDDEAEINNSDEFFETEQELKEKYQKKLSEAITLLSSSFDCITILVSNYEEDGGTRFYEQGKGNWFARLAHADLWVDEMREGHLRLTNPD